VLGINTSALARASAVTIPTSTVNRVVEQLLATGRIRRGFVGLGLQPVRLPEDLVLRLRLAGDVGLMVVSVADGAPGLRAGVLLGDVLVDFDGVRVSDPTELLALLTGDRVGKAVPVRLIRAGEMREIQLTVGERPAH
jgi:S1-C subfamily serine protease